MEFTFFSFKSKKPAQTLIERNKEFWRNELQCLTAHDGNEVVCVRGKDIECVWTEGNEQPMWMQDGSATKANPDYKTSYFISTKGGQKFCLTRKSWLKCRYEDPTFEEPDVIA